MKCMIVLSALVAVCVAAPGFYPGYVAAPHVYGYKAVPYVAPVAVENQYHAQDTLGQYSYGYSGGPSAKTESRSADGSVAGGYSWVDEKGEVQNVQYTADAVHGFRVAASNLPVAPVGPAPLKVEAPVPVEDTVEVVKARAEHLAAFEEVKSRKVDEFVKPVVAAVPVAYSAPIATPYTYPVYNNYVAPAVTSYAAKGFAYSAPAYYPYNYKTYDFKTYDYPESKAIAYSQFAYPETKAVTYTEAKPIAYTPFAYPQAKAIAYTAPVASYVAAPAVTSQFHSQDELGQYAYGYAGGLSAKTETKSFDGVTRGGYSYVDANGEVQNVQYTADAVNGFRVAASNLPVAPAALKVEALETVPETAEVVAAKNAHFAAHVEAKERFAKALY